MKTREEYLEYQRNYYKENKEKQKEKQKEKREANHTEYKDYLKDYWVKNNKDLKVKRLSARLEDPLKTNLIQIKCRSKKIGVPFDLKKEDGFWPRSFLKKRAKKEPAGDKKGCY